MVSNNFRSDFLHLSKNRNTDIQNPIWTVALAKNMLFKIPLTQEWLSQFHWLRFDDKTGNMHCHSCCRTGQDDPMMTGCTNFRTSTLTRHQESNAHTKAIEQLQLQKHFKKAVKMLRPKMKKHSQHIKLQGGIWCR